MVSIPFMKQMYTMHQADARHNTSYYCKDPLVSMFGVMFRV